MVIDIVFFIGIFFLLGSWVLLGMKVFLIVFVIVDDFGVIFVIIVFYFYEVYWGVFVMLGGILAFLFLCNYMFSIKCNWVYLLGGLGVWYYMFKLGIYLIIVGVLVVMVVLVINKLWVCWFVSCIEDFLDEFRMEKVDGGGFFIFDFELY